MCVSVLGVLFTVAGSELALTQTSSMHAQALVWLVAIGLIGVGIGCVTWVRRQRLWSEAPLARRELSGKP